MSNKSQQQNMKVIAGLLEHDLGYIYGERESGPNGAKKVFHKKSTAFLRALAKDLEFNEFKVTINHGGIAVSGEITLMGMWSDDNGFCFQLSQTFIQPPAFLYRAIKNMKDYSGGRNQWLPVSLFADGDYKNLIDLLSSLKKSDAIIKDKLPSRAA